MSTGAFEEHVRRAVADFLQTVVMVDDEAYRVASVSEDEGWADEDREDGAAGSAPTGRRGSPRFGGLKAPSSPPEPDDLDPRATAEAFGRHGLACTMLSPQTKQENVEVRDPLLRTARRADLVVLDWNLNDDDGATTIELFRQMLQDDSGEPSRRLRVVAVYTGEPKLVEIVDQMREAASAVMPTTFPEMDDDGLPQFTCGPVRVAVLAKEHVLTLPPPLESQRLAVAELPDRLTDEFCRLCSGLVPAAAVSALAGIRDDAHRLLTALGPGLDPALLGHRVALDEPENAELHLEALLAAEITAMISDRQVGKHADFARVSEWLDAQSSLPAGGTHEAVTAQQRLDFVKYGLGGDRLAEQVERTGMTKGALKKVQYSATKLFCDSEDRARTADMELAERMVIKTRYSKPSPVLRLGTLVQSEGRYLLCVQPVCDSVRLTAPTQFPLLILEDCGADETGNGVIALRDFGHENEWHRLKIKPTASEMRLATFVPASNGVVEARAVDGSPQFPTPTGDVWRWVADLKTEHAQRVAEQLGSSLSRVGLTESELLRLHKPG